MSKSYKFGTDVAYVAVVVKDPARVHKMLARHLQLPSVALTFEGEACPALQVGKTKLVMLGEGSKMLGARAKTGVHHIGVAATDPAAAAADCGLSIARPAVEPSFNGGARVAISPAATNGLLTYLCEPLAQVAPETEVTDRIDHLGVVTDSNDRSRGIFCDRLGLEVESFQTDIEAEIPMESFTSNKYGVVYHTRAPRLRAGIKGLFVTIGDFDLEFLESFDPGQTTEFHNPSVGNTRQDHSAISRFLASRGPGLHHIAFKVKDINKVLGGMSGAGINVIDYKGRPGGRRSLIGFVHPTGMEGLLIHFVQRLEQ
jgi:catechol 2,3-dioxygenase-like lactoylglutathione lyase family enzyme